MSIVINTPNGNIGRRLTRLLLDAGEHVALLTRDADRVAEFAREGATVYVGDLEDATFVKAATRGAEILFWATPQAYDQPDLIWFQTQLARNVARAIEANEIGRVVNISSIGAQHDQGTGVIRGLREVESLLNETGANVAHLRAGYFMENFLFSLHRIESDGEIRLPIDGDLKLGMIATQDLAVLAANLLCDPEWIGREVRELTGPKLTSFVDAARIIGDVLERPIRFRRVEPERTRAGMIKRGWSPGSADLLLEMYEGLAAGKIAPEGAVYPTLTTFRVFARTKLRKRMAAEA